MRLSHSVLFLMIVTLLGCQQEAPPIVDTHGLAQEVDHKPELARKIIAEVIAEPHGVQLIAEELTKNQLAAGSVVDELMKNPAMAEAIADRCTAAAIAKEVSNPRKAKTPEVKE